MLKWIFCFLFISGFADLANAQIDSLKQITEIRFEGLTRTKEVYLKRFIQSQIGQRFDEEQAKEDTQNLINIESIGNATYKVEPKGDAELILVFELSEVRTLLPIVNFGGIEGNFWFQLGFLDNNWSGKGRNIQFYYQRNDGRHNGQFFYREPRIKGGDWGFTASLLKYSSVEPLFFSEGTVFYDYDNYSFGTSIIRNLDLRKNIELGATFFIENYDQSEDQFINNPPGPASLQQPKFLGKLRYYADQRNFDFFYLENDDIFTQLQTVYNFDDQSLFLSWITQYRKFWRINNKSNLGIRARFGISTNKDSPFAPFVADSYFNLRGIGNRIDRGTAQVVFNIEYRQTVFDKNQWAGQVVAFADMGSWRNPGGQLRDLVDSDQFREFVGGGLRIVYKKIYGAVLRIDYGVDVFDPSQKGFVLGFGQYF